MSLPRILRTTIVAVAALLTTLTTLLTGAAPAAAATDTTPPSTPLFGYAQGFQCLMLIIGVPRSTDNVTPQSQIRYRVIANDTTDIGGLVDQGAYSGVFAILHLPQPGPNTVRVQAIDLAGNRSTSRAVSVFGYFTPGCTPGHL